ncbi:SGNH/GDSL hydrolase family protein [Allosalinactinospora lopnorensis]|uniref:hypothetical protein n=1 Tax=Allosalinactinospora lopnorensis TaxID=1352348 RepID=UPI000623DB00|nr:hypothetical protein [Allosalinactinospora lopnorensis]
MGAAYFLRAVLASLEPRRVPNCPIIAVHELAQGADPATVDGLHPWALGELSKGHEFGLYLSTCALVDEDGEEDDCFREEVLLWNGSEILMRQTRDFDVANAGLTPGRPG